MTTDNKDPRLADESTLQEIRRRVEEVAADAPHLAKIALDGTDVASIAPLLKGPTLLAYSSDPVAAAKVASDFAKVHEKFIILGGAMGKTALNPDGVKALMNMLYSLVLVSFAVEVWKQPRVPDTGAASFEAFDEPELREALRHRRRRRSAAQTAARRRRVVRAPAGRPRRSSR